MSNTIDAFRHYKDSMGHSGWCPIVFLNQETAKLVAEDKKEEWTSFKVEPVKVRILNEQEGAVGNDLVMINREMPDEIHKRRGLAKLTLREKLALGVIEPVLPLPLDVAQQTSRCRYCGKKVTEVRPDNPLVLNYGEQYAHKNCIPNEPGTPDLRPSNG